jgi:hypothetical protein
MSFRTINQQLSDFKDMIQLKKKGQPFVDFEIVQAGDPNVKTQDLEDARQELIALSGVPAPYLGYADAVDLREQLVNINVTFATEISSIQDVMAVAMDELTDKIAGVLGHNINPSEYVKLSFTPPVILMLQLFETTLSSVGNILQVFGSIPGLKVDPYYLLKQYIPNINWKEFEKTGEQFVTKMKMEESPEQQ